MKPMLLQVYEPSGAFTFTYGADNTYTDGVESETLASLVQS
mgnify:CR=1 FL=1